MTYVGPTVNKQEKSLLCFSDKQDRASIVDSFMPPSRRRRGSGRGGTIRRRGRSRVAKRRYKRRSGGIGGRRRGGKRVKTNGIRVVAGRVSLRLAGYPSSQNLPASQLVRHIPITRLRLAARKVLRNSNILGKGVRRSQGPGLRRLRGRRRRRLV